MLKLSSGSQVAEYVAKVHDAATFKANPLSFYDGKKIRTGGLSAKIYQHLGAIAAPTTPNVFFGTSSGLKTFDADGNVQDTYDGGEFIGPWADQMIFQVMTKNMSSVFIKSGGLESNPGVNIVLKQELYDTFTETQKRGWDAVMQTYERLGMEDFEQRNLKFFNMAYKNNPDVEVVDFNDMDIWDLTRQTYMEDSTDPYFAKIWSAINQFQNFYQGERYWLNPTPPFYGLLDFYYTPNLI